MADPRGGRAADAASRHAARERALELLYEVESKGQTVPAVLAELPMVPDEHAVALVEGVERRGEEVDGFVSRFAKGWSVGRMPAVDRAVLRLGTYELLASAHVPTAVVLSEWVTLAGEYSTTDSSRFVNGVLSRIAQEIRPDDAGNAGGAGALDVPDGGDPAP
jgi:transcription antitermination protein NusB